MKTSGLQNFLLSRQYRTPHSIHDEDIVLIDCYVANENVQTFLDYGCHFGHLSIYLALTYDVHCYAVDNFTGTPNDKVMANTIKEQTGTYKDTDFYLATMQNIANHHVWFKGSVSLNYAKDFFAIKQEPIDFAYIDAGHTEEEIGDFQRILNKVKKGGLIGGHDLHPEITGVVKGVQSIESQCDWLVKGYTWLMRKR